MKGTQIAVVGVIRPDYTERVGKYLNTRSGILIGHGNHIGFGLVWNVPWESLSKTLKNVLLGGTKRRTALSGSPQRGRNKPCKGSRTMTITNCIKNFKTNNKMKRGPSLENIENFLDRKAETGVSVSFIDRSDVYHKRTPKHFISKHWYFEDGFFFVYDDRFGLTAFNQSEIEKIEFAKI